jgi:hypothetical protein
MNIQEDYSMAKKAGNKKQKPKKDMGPIVTGGSKVKKKKGGKK